MAVPKASLNLDNSVIPGQDKVGFSWQAFVM